MKRLHYFCFMINNVSNFFIPENTIVDSSGLDYSMAELLVQSAKAFARATYQSVYIIDYNRKGFLYVSDNPLFLCGQSQQEVLDEGYGFYLKHVPEKEHKMLMELNKAGFEFFNKLPIQERFDYTISYDFHLLNNRKSFLINHKLTPIVLTKTGKIWLAMCVVSYSAQDSPGQIVMKKNLSNVYWEYSLESHKWKQCTTIALSEEERAILLLSAQGFKMDEIADQICKSIDTVKFYKRRLFNKMDVKNITEALSFAANNKLI